MWAQLIKVRLKPGKDLAEAATHLWAAEQPGSGLVREMFMRDQNPAQAYILAMFESEEKACGHGDAACAPCRTAAQRVRLIAQRKPQGAKSRLCCHDTRAGVAEHPVTQYRERRWLMSRRRADRLRARLTMDSGHAR
jgi:hypothetical protein